MILTDTSLLIKPLDNHSSGQVAELILPIQQREFLVPITLDDQPDIIDIEAYYINAGGNFLGAFINGELAGTIAVLAPGDNIGVIRKMFVKKEYRGKELGIAVKLMETLIAFSRQAGITDLYLGTIDTMEAAQRFYQRSGFVKINKSDLPARFQLMVTDNRFYHLDLSKPRV